MCARAYPREERQLLGSSGHAIATTLALALVCKPRQTVANVGRRTDRKDTYARAVLIDGGSVSLLAGLALNLVANGERERGLGPAAHEHSVLLGDGAELLGERAARDLACVRANEGMSWSVCE